MIDRFLLLLASVFTQIKTNEAGTSISCKVLADGQQIEMMLRSNDWKQFFGYNPTGTSPEDWTSGCVSEPETIDGMEYEVLKIVNNIASVDQVIPFDTVNQNCFAKRSTNPNDAFTANFQQDHRSIFINTCTLLYWPDFSDRQNGNAIDYDILALFQPSPQLVLADRHIKTTCDPDTPTYKEYESIEEISTQIVLPQESKVPITVTMAVVLVNGDTSQPFLAGTPLSVGHPVKAKIEYTRTLDEFSVAAGIHVYNMEASGYSDFRNTSLVKILDQNGCPVAPIDETKGIGIQHGVKKDDTNNDTTKFIAYSGKFFMFMFLGAPAKFYLRLQYKLCFDTSVSNLQCNDIEAYCANPPQDQAEPQVRKRRSPESVPDSGSLSTSVDIYLGSDNSSNQGSTAAGTDGTEQNNSICNDAYKFWIVSLVLGVLLLVAMVFAIYLYVRLKKEQRHADKPEGKIGVSNPSVET